MKSEPEKSIKKVIEEVLTSLGQSGRIDEARIMMSWENIVGADIASRSIPLFLKAGTLTVAVYNSVWINQLNFFRDEIARKINEYLDDNVVSSVRLVLRKKPEWWPLKKVPSPLRSILSPEDQEIIDKACNSITDPELKDIVRKFLIRQAAFNRTP